MALEPTTILFVNFVKERISETRTEVVDVAYTNEELAFVRAAMDPENPMRAASIVRRYESIFGEGKRYDRFTSEEMRAEALPLVRERIMSYANFNGCRWRVTGTIRAADYDFNAQRLNLERSFTIDTPRNRGDEAFEDWGPITGFPSNIPCETEVAKQLSRTASPLAFDMILRFDKENILQSPECEQITFSYKGTKVYSFAPPRIAKKQPSALLPPPEEQATPTVTIKQLIEDVRANEARAKKRWLGTDVVYIGKVGSVNSKESYDPRVLGGKTTHTWITVEDIQPPPIPGAKRRIGPSDTMFVDVSLEIAEKIDKGAKVRIEGSIRDIKLSFGSIVLLDLKKIDLTK